MKMKKLLTKLPALIRAGEPFLITGAPGIGKTDGITEAGEAADAKVILMHPITSDPTDFKGFPCLIKVDGETEARFVTYGDLAKLLTATERTLFFIDDLGQASKAVQAAAMQLVLGRELNGNRISDHVTFGMASNRRSDKAGVVGIIQPLLSRITCIYELDVDVPAWLEWAYANNMPAELIAFVQYRPELLHKFDPNLVDSSGNDLVNQPCPRTVAAVGRLHTLFGNDLDFADGKGAAGEAFATEYLSFLAMIDKLGDLPKRIAAGEDAQCPEDASVLFALSACLSKMAAGNGCFPIIAKWVSDQMPGEFAARFLKDVETQAPDVTERDGYVELSIKVNGFLSK